MENEVIHRGTEVEELPHGKNLNLVLNIVKDPEKLTVPLEHFSFTHPPTDPVELANKLIETMLAGNALGVSANQIGLPYRVFVMHTSPTTVCYNPRIVNQDGEEIILEEGCLSFPDLFVKIKRPRTIRVRYQDANGHTHTKKLDGISARIFQHELDHLDGILFYQRAGSIHRDAAFKKQRELARMRRKLKDPMTNKLLQTHLSQRNSTNG
jgi:peptide deformylase